MKAMQQAFWVLPSRALSPHVLQPAALVGVQVGDVLEGLARAPAGLGARAVWLARPANAVLQQGVLEAVVVVARGRHCTGAQHAGLASGMCRWAGSKWSMDTTRRRGCHS
jgi:hypothetical protein